LSLRPRPEIEALLPGVHGGPDHAELQARGLEVDGLLDFSVCCNPYPPPRAVRESLRHMSLGRYPDSTSTELRNKLSRLHLIDAANILTGSGTTELIRLITLTYLERGDSALVFKPTYGEYETASRLSGAKIIIHQGFASENFALDVERVANMIQETHPRAVFIGNPNNPTGQYLSAAEMETLFAGSHDSLFIVDEAYINFVEHPWPSLDLRGRENVIILRSMTKDYGLAGLRLGYLVASEEIVRTLSRVCPPWNVNIAAQKAGSAVLDSGDYLSASLIKIRKAGQYLRSQLIKLNLPVVPSQANFFLVKAGDGKRFRSLLLNEGILVRDCASFGLPEYIRLAPRSLGDCRLFISALKRLKKAGRLFYN
jgi:histidinol-phosphate aminotransferase